MASIYRYLLLKLSGIILRESKSAFYQSAFLLRHLYKISKHGKYNRIRILMPYKSIFQTFYVNEPYFFLLTYFLYIYVWDFVRGLSGNSMVSITGTVTVSPHFAAISYDFTEYKHIPFSDF